MIRSIYMYVVSIITLVMAITGGTMLFNSVADIVAPDIYVQSYQDFVRGEYPELQTGYSELNETTLRAEYDLYIETEENNEKKTALNSLISAIGLIVISLPIFFFFQRKISAERKEARRSNNIDA